MDIFGKTLDLFGVTHRRFYGNRWTFLSKRLYILKGNFQVFLKDLREKIWRKISDYFRNPGYLRRIQGILIERSLDIAWGTVGLSRKNPWKCLGKLSRTYWGGALGLLWDLFHFGKQVQTSGTTTGPQYVNTKHSKSSQELSAPPHHQ